MQNIYKSILFLLFLFLITGCSSKKLTIKSLQPSKIPNEKIYSISVEDFVNDDIYQSLKIKSKLANKIIEGKKVFKVSNNFQNVDAIVQGWISSSLNYSTYYEEEIDYKRCKYYRHEDKKKAKKCLEYHVRLIPCENREYNVETNLNVLKQKTNEILFTKTYNKSRNIQQCFRYHYYPYHTIPRDKREINTKLAALIADEFIDDISPHYEYWDVNIIEELDEKTLNFNDIQEERFEKAVELLENRHFDIAKIEFEKLNNEFKSKSFEVIYNLALINEAFNKLENAKNLYVMAKTLTTNIDYLDLVKYAINRTSINLEEKIKAKSQLP
jgi:hypothetical protein